MRRSLPVPRMICLLSLTSALVFFTCNEEPTVPPTIPTPTKPTIRLEVQYEDFTEVLLKVTVSDTSKWKFVTIHRDGKLVHFESFLSKDTVITDDGLESNTTYSYQASLIENGRAIDSSVITAKTREYGSHNWRFEIDTIGENLSGAKEVIAFSSTNAWATGDFRIYDKQNPKKWQTYCLAHWNGNRWELIQFKDSNDISFHSTTLYGFAVNDIWLYASWVMHYDGNSWKILPRSITAINGAANRIFGKNTNDFYSVGLNGAIAHWDGNRFSNIASPTTIDLKDIFGDENEIFTVGTTSDGKESVMLEIRGMKAIKIDSSKWGRPNFYQRTSIWFKKRDSVFAQAGDRNVITSRGKSLQPDISISNIYTNVVRGTGPNNVWFAGSWSYLLHFDGKSWRTYPEVRSAAGNLYSLVVFDDFFFAAGHAVLGDGSIRGTVIRGYRK